MDGEYVIARTEANWMGSTFVSLPGTFSDAVLSVDVRLMQDHLDRYPALWCRVTGSGDTGDTVAGYEFRFYPTFGSWFLNRFDRGGRTVLARGSSQAIVRDVGWNHVELSCVGSTITASVNGQQLRRFQDGFYAEGSWGISATMFFDGGARGLSEARFDNLEARSP